MVKALQGCSVLMCCFTASPPKLQLSHRAKLVEVDGSGLPPATPPSIKAGAKLEQRIFLYKGVVITVIARSFVALGIL